MHRLIYFAKGLVLIAALLLCHGTSPLPAHAQDHAQSLPAHHHPVPSHTQGGDDGAGEACHLTALVIPASSIAALPLPSDPIGMGPFAVATNMAAIPLTFSRVPLSVLPATPIHLRVVIQV